jgi:hypothetical protein
VFEIQNRTTARFKKTRETEQYLNETHGFKITPTKHQISTKIEMGIQKI